MALTSVYPAKFFAISRVSLFLRNESKEKVLMHYLKHVYLLLLAAMISFNASGVTDSLGVKEEDGKKFIMHRVDKGQTLFAISQRYGVSVDQLKETNPQTKDDLVVGEVILIPMKAYQKAPGQYHTVQKEETLYSISQQYDVEVEQIKEWNDLSSNNIEKGQELKVGEPADKENDTQKKGEQEEAKPDSKNITPEGPGENSANAKAEKPVDKGPKEKDDQSANDKAEAAKSQAPDQSEADSKESDTSQPKSKLAKKFKETKNTDQDQRSGDKVSKSQEGKATWLSHIDSEKSLALHRSAPPGTIIKVTNLVNDEVVYVKTVGKLNKNEDEATLITISPKAAEKLNVSNDFFRAKLEYSYRKSSN